MDCWSVDDTKSSVRSDSSHDFGLSVSAYVLCEFSAVTVRALRGSGLTRVLINCVDDFGGSIGPIP
jgi:hypothetical protein